MVLVVFNLLHVDPQFYWRSIYVFHFIAVVALVKLVLSQFLKEKKKIDGC